MLVQSSKRFSLFIAFIKAMKKGTLNLEVPPLFFLLKKEGLKLIRISSFNPRKELNLASCLAKLLDWDNLNKMNPYFNILHYIFMNEDYDEITKQKKGDGYLCTD